jgi:PKD repeat protein
VEIMKIERKKLVMFTIMLSTIIISIFAFTIAINAKNSLKSENDNNNSPLLVKIFTDETIGAVPFKINFEAWVNNNRGNVKYYWDFGDGNVSNEINPSYIYNGSGFYFCNLTVTDSSGRKDSDSIEIICTTDLGITPAIDIKPVTSSRPFIIGLATISSNYGGRLVEYILNSPIPNPRLDNLKGWVDCKALVDDPKNEIVSFNWELRPPSYVNLLLKGGGIEQPVYHFKGKNVTFPGKLTYRLGQYDVTLTVEDSKGRCVSVSTKFKIERSQRKSQIDSAKGQYKNINDQWLKKWSKVAAGVALVAVLSKVFPDEPSFIRLRILQVLFLKTGWNIELENVSIWKLYEQFLDEHPIRKNLIKNTLLKLQLKTENIKEKIKNPTIKNSFNGFINLVKDIRKNLGFTNLVPVISNEKPNINSKYVSPNINNVSIEVTDPEGDPFNISITGDYINDIYLTNQYNNTFNANIISPLPFETDIFWNVNVCDSSGRCVNETFVFTTRWS